MHTISGVQDGVGLMLPLLAFIRMREKDSYTLFNPCDCKRRNIRQRSILKCCRTRNFFQKNLTIKGNNYLDC
jgi:hypothetical protein